MTMVIETLREEHRNIERLLRALERQVEIFAGGESPDYDVVVGIADYFLDFPDHCHHPKEDLIAARLAARYPETAAVTGHLASDHAALHQRALRFRQTVAALLNDSDIPRAEIVDAARRFIDAQRAHMSEEEVRFLPWTERLLTSADWRSIGDNLSRRRDPIFSGQVEAGFRKLSERLLAWEAEDEALAGGDPPRV